MSLMTPNMAMTSGATVVQILSTDQAVHTGPARVVGAWIHHTATQVLTLYDATAVGTAKFSVRCPANGQGEMSMASPGGVRFTTGIHAGATSGAAFIAYVPL